MPRDMHDFTLIATISFPMLLEYAPEDIKSVHLQHIP